VLRDISLEIPDGTYFTLLGPSGCGKTTLLRIIAGLERPDTGSIVIGGKDVTRVPPAKRDISMVFQSYALYPHMTVFKNIATPLRLRSMREDEVARRVRDTAALLKITDLLDKRPKVLSGGERQRVALARALVREPKVFLMDEPLSNLDALLREQTRTELKILFSRVGATVIHVTHDQVEAMALSDFIAVLHDGRIQQAGPPSDIYESPSNEFVAGFVGSPRMNFLPVRVVSGSLVFSSGRSIPIPGRFTQDLTSLPNAALLGFRPEDAEFDGGGIPFSGEVLAVETLGAQSVLLMRTPEGEAKIIAPSGATKRSETVSFSVPEKKVRLFSRPGGESWMVSARNGKIGGLLNGNALP